MKVQAEVWQLAVGGAFLNLDAEAAEEGVGVGLWGFVGSGDALLVGVDPGGHVQVVRLDERNASKEAREAYFARHKDCRWYRVVPGEIREAVDSDWRPKR